MKILGLTIMKTTTYEASVRNALETGLAVARISDRLGYSEPPPARHRRRGGHLRLVDSPKARPDTELGLLWLAPRDTA